MDCYVNSVRIPGPPLLAGGVVSLCVYLRGVPFVPDIDAFRPGIGKASNFHGVERDCGALDITVFGYPGQWRTGEEVAS